MNLKDKLLGLDSYEIKVRAHYFICLFADMKLGVFYH